jgi:hypothetical protein
MIVLNIELCVRELGIKGSWYQKVTISESWIKETSIHLKAGEMQSVNISVSLPSRHCFAGHCLLSEVWVYLITY